MTLYPPSVYRGWNIVAPRWPDPWTATSPDYEAEYLGEEDGWVSNGESVTADSYEDLCTEINTFYEEHAIQRDREQIAAWLPTQVFLVMSPAKSLAEKILKGEHWNGVAEAAANG